MEIAFRAAKLEEERIEKELKELAKKKKKKKWKKIGYNKLHQY